MTDHLLLWLAVDLARQAGEAIVAIRARGFRTDRKADDSPVTEADRAAEALIVAGLRGATPDIPVVAEEEIAAGHVPARHHTTWLVDPLDGTREFAAGRDEYVVNIGLVRDGRAVLGAVGVPATGEVFGGLVGVGAWKWDQAGQHAIRVRRPPPAGLTVLASRRRSGDPQLEALLRGHRVEAMVNMGSALKFCRVAEGAADLYPRLGRTMEWDTAAPQAVLEAAGGRMCALEGAPLRYGKPGWENPSFLCTGLDTGFCTDCGSDAA